MKLADVREAYYAATGKAGDTARTLSLAGIAIIWIFKVGNKTGAPALPRELIIPAILFAASLASDLLQYCVASVIWGIYNRRKELSKISEETEFLASPFLNWPMLVFFWLKLIFVIVSYAFLFVFLVQLWS